MTRSIATAGAIVALAIFLPACSGDSTLTIHNDSSYALYEINLSPVDSRTWGPDLLAGDTLFPGETIEIFDIDCNDYDVRLVDEDGDDCVIEDVGLCFDDEVWSIDDLQLAICTLFTGGAR